MPDVQSLTSDQIDQILLGRYESDLSSLCPQLPGTHDQPTITWKNVGPAAQHTLLRKLARPQRLWQKFGFLPKIPPSGHSVLMESFAHSILNGGEPLVTGESGLRTLELINGIILSAMKKKIVNFPIDPEECDHLFDRLESENPLGKNYFR